MDTLVSITVYGHMSYIMVKDKKGDPHLAMKPSTADCHCSETHPRTPTAGTNLVTHPSSALTFST